MYTSNIVYRDMSSGGGETMFPANQCDNKSDKWISPTKSLTKPQNEITAASTKDICVLVRTQSSNNEGETATSTLIKSWIWVLAMSKDAKVPRWQGAKWDGDKKTSSRAKQPGHFLTMALQDETSTRMSKTNTPWNTQYPLLKMCG